MNWLYYLAEANIYLGVFYLAYCLFLTKETYYQLNRAYLLFSYVAAFILPVLQIGSLKPVEKAIVNTVNYTLPTEVITTNVVTAPPLAPIVTEPVLSLQDYLLYTYLIGAAILLLALIVKLYTLYKLLRNTRRIKQDNHNLVYLPETDVAFSFFNYLFIGTNARGANTIIRHELVHINQKHSVDIVFLEVIKIISWFNPCIYLLQNSLKTIHEYIADEQTAAYESDALTYSSFLVNNAYGAGGSSITHSFFNYNLLKKRIIMLNQQRSGNLARLKYLLAIPICAGMLCASTLAFSKTYTVIDLAPARVEIEQPVAIANTKDPAPQKKPINYPTPSFAKNGYKDLILHIRRNISFNNAVKDKNGSIGIGFTVEKNHKITGIKVVRSGEKALETITVNAFNNFTGTVTDKPGEHHFLVSYYSPNGSDAAPHKADNTPYDVSISISVPLPPPPLPEKPTSQKPKATQVKFPPPIVRPDGNTPPKVSQVKFPPPVVRPYKLTNKGYSYREDAFVINNIANYRVIIKENGSDKIYLKNSATPATIKLLKDEYGYTFPDLPIYTKLSPPPPEEIPNQVKFPPPVIKPDANTPTKVSQVKFPPPVVVKDDDQNPQQYFYDHLKKGIRYPAVARDNNITGKVYTVISVDENHNISYAKVIRTASVSLGEEVLRVLKTLHNVKYLKPGETYTIPITFAIKGGGPMVNVEEKPADLVYNPKSVQVASNNNLMLNEVVIVSYK